MPGRGLLCRAAAHAELDDLRAHSVLHLADGLLRRISVWRAVLDTPISDGSVVARPKTTRSRPNDLGDGRKAGDEASPHLTLSAVRAVGSKHVG